LAGVLSSVGVAQDSVTITTDPKDLSRPVSTLLSQLREREKISVTYEDPRYVNVADIQDVTTQVAKNLSPAEEKFGPHILVPKGKAITFVYTPQDMRTPEGAEANIARMLREYRALGGPAFTVKRDGIRLHVLPSEVLSAAGDPVKQDSILDTVVSIPAGRRTTNQLLQSICDEIKKQTGYQVDAGTGDPTYTNPTRQVVDSQTARAAIAGLLDSLATPGDFVWDLYYDPSDKAYVLNFSYIGRAGRVEK
jgi:hypothetical protein